MRSAPIHPCSDHRENAEGLRVGDNILIVTGETLVILPSM